jgi:hypothetical protein
VKRWLRYVAYAALAVTLLLATGAYAVYRSLLPADLPERPTPSVPPMVRGAVQVMLGPNAKATLARLHLGRLQDQGRLPQERLMKWRWRVLALEAWLSLHWSAEEVADAYAAQAWLGDDRIGLASGAQALFAKPLHQLAPHEVALLMGLAWSPQELDPACHPEQAREARDAFLTNMAAAHLIAAEAVPAMQAMPVQVLDRCLTSSSATR